MLTFYNPLPAARLLTVLGSPSASRAIVTPLVDGPSTPLPVGPVTVQVGSIGWCRRGSAADVVHVSWDPISFVAYDNPVVLPRR